MSISLDRIADVRLSAGDRAGALTYFEKSLAIAEKLAAADPDRPEWQRDVSISLNKIADVRLSAGDRAGALTYFEKSLAIREKLAAADPDDRFQTRRDVGVSRYKIAGALATSGKVEEALAQQNQAIDIFAKLAADDPERPDFQVIVARAATWVGLLDAAIAIKRSEDCLNTLRQMVTLESAQNPQDMPKRIEAIQRLVGQAPLRDAHRSRLVTAIGTLRELDAAEKLGADDKEWIALIEAALAPAQKSTRAKPGFLGRLLGRKA